MLGRQPLEHWSVGRISLLGDACHPTLPFLAQGANMAMKGWHGGPVPGGVH